MFNDHAWAETVLYGLTVAAFLFAAIAILAYTRKRRNELRLRR